MRVELTVGGYALYQSQAVEVMELIGHDQIQIRVGTGIRTVARKELIPMSVTPDALEASGLDDISDVEWQAAQARANVIRAILTSPTGRTRAIRDGAVKLGLSERQLQRLVDQYSRSGTVTSLLHAKVGRKFGAQLLDPERELIITECIEQHHLQRHEPRISALVDQVEARCREKGLAPVSRKCIKRRLEAYETHEAQRRRLGSKRSKYVYKGMPGHVQVSKPLERVEIDHTPMDVMARSDDPLCEYVGRPWLTVAIDVYTRCVLGLHIGFEPPSILSVALCLTHAVLPKHPAQEFGVPLDWPMCGLPKEIMVDNGKEFQSAAFRRGCDEYGILLSYRPIGSPHYGGTIERLIGTMVGKCHLLPGTTKNSVRAKRDYDPQKHASLTLKQLRSWFVEQLLGNYHLREHRMLRIPPSVAWKCGMESDDAAA
jgi:putative transposase